MPSKKKSLLIHPGEILQEEFLGPLGMTQLALSEITKIPTSRITEIIKGRRGISADTAIKLSKAFSTSAEFWMRLQSVYELEKIRILKTHGSPRAKKHPNSLENH